jgi:hypothetical protein
LSKWLRLSSLLITLDFVHFSRVKRDWAGDFPVSSVARPALRMSLLRTLVYRVPAFQALLVYAAMTVRWRDILDATVQVLFVVSPLER